MGQGPTAGDLAEQLRRLRQRAQRGRGGLAVSKLATAAGVSQQSVYAYLAGTTLPPAGIFDDLLQALGASGEESVKLWHLRDTVEESRRSRLEPPADPGTPSRWPKLVGILPAAADCYVDRHHGLAALEAGQVTVVLAGTGGVGKTQTAARHARALLRSGAVDLVVWLTASTRDAVVSAYARAADEIGLASADAEDAAARLHAWFETTTRRWLVVLDDIDDPEAIRGLRPPVDRGRVIVTTRRRDSAIRGGGRRFVEMPPFSGPQSLGYLGRKLAGRDETVDSLGQLAAEFGHHPLALAQACAYIVDRGLSCDEYSRRVAEHRHRLREVMPERTALPDDHGTSVDTIWSLSISRADALPPTGLAGPALALASVVHGPAIPIELWTTPAGLNYLGSGSGTPITGQQAVDALHNLARLSLLDIDTTASIVTVHTLVQASVRASIAPPALADLVRAAADALTQSWPERRDGGRSPILRANAQALQQVDDEALWRPAPHEILVKVGNSLGDFGHVAAAARYFDEVVARVRELHGDRHQATLDARMHRAVWLGKRGDAAYARDELAELITLAAELLDRHDVLAAALRGNHAYFVGQAGDYARAIELCRGVLEEWDGQALDDGTRFGLESNAAFFTGHAGRYEEAAHAYKLLCARASDLLGPDHVDTFKIRANAIGWRGKAGDKKGALREFRELRPQVEKALGGEHTIAIRTRFHIVRLARECGEAAALDEIGEILAASERLLGWTHPHTLEIRVECALLARDRDDHARAAEQLQGVLADALAVFGEGHPRTIAIEKHLSGF